MNLLSRSMVSEIIRSNAGQFFSCGFFKTTGDKEFRVMKCRTGVKKHLKGGSLAYNPSEYGLIPVWEVQDEADKSENAYRMVNVNTMVWLRINGQEYRIMDLVDGEVKIDEKSGVECGQKQTNSTGKLSIVA